MLALYCSNGRSVNSFVLCYQGRVVYLNRRARRDFRVFPVGLPVNAREIVLVAHLPRLLKILNVRFVLKRSCSNHGACRGGGLVA